jgi:hypothetical protein
MRKSAAVAAINLSASRSIMLGGGGAAFAMSPGRPSHWSVLKTVNRLRKGMAGASSPVSAARLRSSWPVRARAVFLDIAVLRDGRCKPLSQPQPVTANPVRTLTLISRSGQLRAPAQ